MGPERRPSIGLIIALAAATVYLAYHLRQILIPFGLSFALAYLANPVVNVFEARGMRRDRIVIMFYLLIAAAISMTASFLLPVVMRELSLLQTNAPGYFKRSSEYLSQVQVMVAHKLPIGQSIVEHWNLQLYTPLIEHFQKLPGYLLGLFPLLSLLFLVPFITFFFLMDSSRIMRDVIQSCPSRWVEQVLHVTTEIDTSMGSYVRSVMIESFLVGLMAFLGLYALNVNYALAIATLVGVSSFVPYAGALLGGTVACTVALFQYGTPLAFLKVALLFLAIRGVDDLLLQPILSKTSVHLHPVAYLLALMIGGEAFGFTGLILGVPAACILKTLFRVGWDFYTSEVLMRSDSPPGLRIPYV
ncbi:MAG: AI-2E family transporter [Elusimicrobia bacterium]|nr:AI-2E family transporter [Elusimicrobiota bacterium]